MTCPPPEDDAVADQQRDIAMSDTAPPTPDIGDDDLQTETYRAWFDWDEYEPASSTVVETVARATGTAPAELDALFERVDPCALNQLFEATPANERPTDGRVAFRYEGYEVTVHGHGEVVVRSAGGIDP